MIQTYALPGALFELGEKVSYGDATYVVIARRRTPIGIVYQLLSDGAAPHGHHNVPQGVLGRLTPAEARKR